MPPIFVITCEHGGNAVPAEYASRFASAGARAAIQSHRGYDPGAFEAALQFSRSLGVEPISSTTSRLLVDLNRSTDNPELLSKFTQNLSPSETAVLLERHYFPYRHRVTAAIEKGITDHHQVFHLSIHTFTPRIRGVWRDIDVGLLFDPARKSEAEFCERWQQELACQFPSLRVRPNEPYKGVDDGFTTVLRRQFADHDYVGVEVEINNRFAKRSVDAQAKRVKALLQTLPHRTHFLDGSDTHPS
ncbi:N-formylglutamate amidohydrolase [Rhodopirellula sp. ICT_H3.1]|uniref:N-formylglutamate amidohydrolase n=2 Tax=Aporhodopirellula aestuarii TaxID=2950107 RepID=A0ABT0UE28_9BACT|nr:N-formylglutamate amidohydrolase [Aporhodopirellula aestuarii]